jgi:hypothetical protein
VQMGVLLVELFNLHFSRLEVTITAFLIFFLRYSTISFFGKVYCVNKFAVHAKRKEGKNLVSFHCISSSFC